MSRTHAPNRWGRRHAVALPRHSPATADPFADATSECESSATADVDARVLSEDPTAIGLSRTTLFEVSADGLISAANDAFARLLGRSRADLVGHSSAEFTHPDDLAITVADITTVITGPHSTTCREKRYVRADGTVVWVRVTAAWQQSQNRAVMQVADISDLVQARDEADAARARLAALVDHSVNQIFVIDSAMRLMDANPATERLFGPRIGQSATAILSELVHPDDLVRVLAVLTDTVNTPGPHEAVTFRLSDATGGWVHLEAVANNQLDNPAVRGIVINARDVSQQVLHAAQIEDNRRSLIRALGRTAESRDPYTAGHQHRVADLAVAIAAAMDLDARTAEGIGLGATIHDIGKIAIPAEILSHPGRLSPAAYELVKTHCQVGYDIVAEIDFPWPIAEVILQHHERLDGSGYPNGVRGSDILLEAQIVAVADVCEAIVSHRPYRPARDPEVALEALRGGRGTQFNTDAVDSCTALIRTGWFGSEIKP